LADFFRDSAVSFFESTYKKGKPQTANNTSKMEGNVNFSLTFSICRLLDKNAVKKLAVRVSKECVVDSGRKIKQQQ